MARAAEQNQILRATAQHGVRGPVVIAVMDGVGIGTGDEGDAVAQAHTPYLDTLRAGPLSCELAAHGTAVGLSDSDMGNSEVGHNALGAGRVFDQGAKRVAEAFASGDVFTGQTWLTMVAHLQRHDGALHLIGLLSDGNIHSHIDHTLAIIAKAESCGLKSVYVHTLLDGRDVARTSAHLYLARLEAALAGPNAKPGWTYAIASGGGRMQVTMDRYGADWPMVARGWALHVLGQGRTFSSASAALATMRQEQPNIGDQDLPGFVVARDGRPLGVMGDGDAVLATNFRGDRILQLCEAFEHDGPFPFERGLRPHVLFVGMTLYDGEQHRPRHFLVTPPQISGTLGERLAAHGVHQLACSETHKFGHVTYFWNGNRSNAFDPKREQYIEVPSLKVAFDAQPCMRAEAIVDATVAAMAARPFGLVRINFANGDMVGHTGNFAATQAAVAAVDRAIARLAQAVAAQQGALVVTADHGNAEDMVERDVRGVPLRNSSGELFPKTSHSRNPVPFAVVLGAQDSHRFVAAPAMAQAMRPGLSNVAATCLTLMGLSAPQDAFEPSLLDVVS